MNQTLDFGCRGGADAARAFSEEAPIAKSHAWYAMNRLKLVPARILWDRADHRRSLTSFALPHFSLRRKTSAQANEPRLRALHTSPDLSRISLSTSTGSALYCTTRPLRRAAAPTGYLDMSHDSFFDIELGPPTSPASTLTFPYGVPSPTWSEFSTTSTLPVSDESPKLPFSYSDSNLKKMGSLTGLGLRPRLGAFSASPPPSSPASARARCTSGRVVSPLSRSVPTRRRAQSDTSVLSQVQLQVAGLPGPETPQTPFGDPTTIVVKVYVPATADLWRIRIAEDTTFDELMDSIQSKLGYTVRLHVQVLTRPEGTTNTQCPPDETIAEAVAQIKSQEEFAGWMQDRLVFGSKHRLIAVRIE
ncbi:hypothetical protein PUNSTDRAFT_139952 [Punctularia strigosozonata HHB-11173 SS5]|uniref:uncharacterized protein n=1 Tax=Punctularia strigosozonata (strain HHB-11173) TaxID=741275 RepID=UPI0004416952|nr:uncharacterized protein PUNSTDRAFT_139952 [Punctularia strigosozonata HHB-11173 SS5]EIN13397.1 hypothetical protein PUNSTDRAFT_139952 [Punctularia strigosozonata HHB-11173 SS5]